MIEDYYYHKLRRSCGSLKKFVLSMMGIIIVVILCILQGCTTVKYVPVETTKIEYKTVRDSFFQKDSVFLKDSVFIHSKGDTVWYEKWHIKYRDKIVEKVIVDSFIKTDSIRIPYPVEKKLSKWEQLKIDLGGFSVAILLVIILVIIIWILKM